MDDQWVVWLILGLTVLLALIAIPMIRSQSVMRDQSIALLTLFLTGLLALAALALIKSQPSAPGQSPATDSSTERNRHEL